MNKLYNGLELNYTNWTIGEKVFWHEKAKDGANNWEARIINKDGQLEHYASFAGIENRPDLGKFKHFLKTDNDDFEFRIFEKGILRILKESTKIRIQKELDNECSLKWVANFY
jgi:hypothetical protein